MEVTKLRFTGVKPNADPTICIATLKYSLGLKHYEAKEIVNAAKQRQVRTIEFPTEQDKNVLVSNLNFVGLQVSQYENIYKCNSGTILPNYRYIHNHSSIEIELPGEIHKAT